MKEIMRQKQAVTIGTGHLPGPPKVITNEVLASGLGVTEEWTAGRAGIKVKRLAASDEYSSTLASSAARPAFEAAELKASEIDLIICATVTTDYLQMPATLCLVQSQLSAGRGAAFELAVCRGFIYALDTAQKFVASGAYKNAVVIGADLMTRCVNESDAAVLSASENGRGILATELGSNGANGNLIYTPASGTRRMTSCATVHDRQQFMQMRGRELFKIAVVAVPASSRIVLKRANLTLADVDLVIPHQANQRIIDAVAARLNVAPEKVFSNMEQIGNTGAATVPVVLDQCLRSGRMKSGDAVLLTAFGGAIT